MGAKFLRPFGSFAPFFSLLGSILPIFSTHFLVDFGKVPTPDRVSFGLWAVLKKIHSQCSYGFENPQLRQQDEFLAVGSHPRPKFSSCCLPPGANFQPSFRLPRPPAPPLSSAFLRRSDTQSRHRARGPGPSTCLKNPEEKIIHPQRQKQGFQISTATEASRRDTGWSTFLPKFSAIFAIFDTFLRDSDFASGAFFGTFLSVLAPKRAPFRA